MTGAGHAGPPQAERVSEAAWLHRRARERRAAYRELPPPGLLSFVTPVWNTPPAYLASLAASVLGQAGDPPLEWVVLDNGSTDAATIAVLDQQIAPHPKVSFYRSPANLGIVAGSRFCLEKATGRYVVFVDHDDRLYADCACTVAEWLQRTGYPAAMYSDEDKLVDGEPMLPFLKPSWDPVLFANQCYTAHLDVVSRQAALEVGAFTDEGAEGSPDWDCLMRLHLDGHDPVHLPEVLYSWRMHPASTAQNMGSKDYIHSSQRAVVERYRLKLPRPGDFDLELSPLFPGTPDWRLRRRHRGPRPALLLMPGAEGPGAAIEATSRYPFREMRGCSRSTGPLEEFVDLPDWLPDDGLVAVVDSAVRISEPDWMWEALGIMERYPDTGMVGGRLLDARDRILCAGQVLGFEPLFGCPDKGRSVNDAGYSVWLLKQRSVSGVSASMCVFTAGFLRDGLRSASFDHASWAGLGEWAGACAVRSGSRVVYTPFMTGRVADGALPRMPQRERSCFLEEHGEILARERWYPSGFGLTLATNYRPVASAGRGHHLARVRVAPDAAHPGDHP